MPHLKASNKEDATIIIGLDPSFTGVLRGVAHDESEGCTVKGNCIVKVNKPIKVRRFWVWLEGRSKVTLKSNTYTVASSESTESRTLYSRNIHFLGDDGLTQILTPGQYIYPFSFDLPPSLPASFRGKRGYIRYRLQAVIYRPMFASDIQVSRDIPIKRCLLNEETPIAELRETYEGRHHTNKLHYTATAPSITYREGGLVRLNLTMQLTRPETQSIRVVTCALRERIQYRTTDGQANTVLSKTDNLFPLGYSTFYPNQSPDYDPKEKADYNALFRLCPRVNADLNSRLMKVTHALVVNIMVEDSCKEDNDDDYCESMYDTEATESEWASEDDRIGDVKYHPVESPASTPPNSAPSSPVLSRSSSTSSLASIFSLGRNHSNEDAMTSIPTIKNTRRKHKHGSHHKDNNEPRLILCTLEIPLVVTSREHIWNEKPNLPPSYDAVEEPPSYNSSLETLPRAPTYNESPSSSSINKPSTPLSEGQLSASASASASSASLLSSSTTSESNHHHSNSFTNNLSSIASHTSTKPDPYHS
ncbi:uncharacterized protein BX663DRAFT_516251 [Cokeromyces recurvatus]|uniref:uncharacterized protein n=1 Tax=Cokeromyces recurvatus TaxID=90255 RepID=UPI00221E8291|nr:uncharacterized protein BX663DRAFT_516251 [Cokeromyces recurvatus]KAI7901080.1 hypothetical protein BX663DRAFT_516251 [Cokeromyces recurvatus]